MCYIIQGDYEVVKVAGKCTKLGQYRTKKEALAAVEIIKKAADIDYTTGGNIKSDNDKRMMENRDKANKGVIRSYRLKK